MDQVVDVSREAMPKMSAEDNAHFAAKMVTKLVAANSVIENKDALKKYGVEFSGKLTSKAEGSFEQGPERDAAWEVRREVELDYFSRLLCKVAQEFIDAHSDEIIDLAIQKAEKDFRNGLEEVQLQFRRLHIPTPSE